MYYEVGNNGTKSKPYSLRLVRKDKCNILYGETRFRSKARCQDWADRMNSASGAIDPSRWNISPLAQS